MIDRNNPNWPGVKCPGCGIEYHKAFGTCPVCAETDYWKDAEREDAQFFKLVVFLFFTAFCVIAAAVIAKCSS